MAIEKTLPKLYKKASGGAMQEWTIRTWDSTIVTRHGQVGGKIQETTDVVKKGKNLGKANATTAIEQAQLEAEARWTLKKTKNGYVEDVARAKGGETDHEGGIAPMLAKSFAKDGKKILFPCAVQPKLDGIRCVAVVHNGEVELWTRTRKPIVGLPHVRAALVAALPTGSHVLDGELYNHAMKNDFEKIVSAVRGGKDTEDSRSVEYHVYDFPSIKAPFSVRSAVGRVLLCGTDLTENERAVVLRAAEGGGINADTPLASVHAYIGRTPKIGHVEGPIVLVETYDVDDEVELMEAFQDAREEGYEGAMARNLAGEYAEGKRSADLQKIKEFEDAEFSVVGVEEGRGKLAGHVGAFVCKAPEGEEFRAKMMGSTERLKALFEGPESAWKGQKLTVRFQGWTTAKGVPRFPVGVSFRDYE